jgi:hypothetical protein
VDYASLVPSQTFGLRWTIRSSVSQYWASVPHQPQSWWNMQCLQETIGVGVTAKVRTSHRTTTEEILQAHREGPNASAHQEPKAPATSTQSLAAADIRPSVVPVCSQFLSVGLRALVQDSSDCKRGTPNPCATTAISSTGTSPSRRGAALQAPRHLPVSRRDSRGDGLRSLFWRHSIPQR